MNSYELDDFVQTGLIGLLKAVKKYDVNHFSGATFNTYAYYWIRAELNRFETQ